MKQLATLKQLGLELNRKISSYDVRTPAHDKLNNSTMLARDLLQLMQQVELGTLDIAKETLLIKKA